MNHSSEYLIYLSIEPFLAQWYADRCRRHAHKDDIYYQPEIYRFDRNHPVGVQPIKNSRDSNYLKLHLQKQPTDIPEPIPEDATLAIRIPNFKHPFEPEIFNYASPKVRKNLGLIIYLEFKVELVDYIMRTRDMGLQFKQIQEDFCESHGMDYMDDRVEYNVNKVFSRVRKSYIYNQKKIESCQE